MDIHDADRAGTTRALDSATTGDDLLTALAAVRPEYRETALAGCGVRVLREAADLCLVDVEGLGKRGLVCAIVTNF